MNSYKTEIDQWLVNDTSNDNSAVLEKWEPIFDADRHVVYSKFGPFKRLFLRPEKFVKRFYHQVYPLPVEHWCISKQLELYDGFCTIDVTLDVCFQATLKYALNNIDTLSEINTHIKSTYEDLVINVIDTELLSLSDGTWVQKGITDIEEKIAFAIGEMLILQNIQSRPLCTINPTFKDFPDVQLAHKNVYLCVLKQSFDFNNEKREELFRQDQETEKQKQAQKRKLLDQLKLDGELERLKQTQEALNKKFLLEEQEKQLLEQFEIEKRIHAEKVKQENILKEISFEADIREQEKHKTRLRMAEQKDQMELLAQQSRLKEKKLEADIAYYEIQQSRWQEAKNKAENTIENQAG
jgi:hypothetical protein